MFGSAKRYECALCGTAGELVKSHLIPKFYFEWLKRTGTGFVRMLGDPNRRRQDGVKVELLCNECEQRFSPWEKWFAESVFHPYITDGKTDIEYGRELYAFLLSVLWRALRVFLDEPGDVDARHRKAAEIVEARWRAVLLGTTNASTLDEVHMLMTDVGTVDGVIPVVGWSSYIARASDLAVASNDKRAFVYVKFARFVVLGALTPFKSGEMINTKIDPGGGVIETPQGLEDGDIGEFIVDRARMSTEIYRGVLSDAQRQDILQRIHRNPDEFRNSDLGSALRSDHEADVLPFELSQRKIGRNEKCPCGSGKKFKRCHGR